MLYQEPLQGLAQRVANKHDEPELGETQINSCPPSPIKFGLSGGGLTQAGKEGNPTHNTKGRHRKMKTTLRKTIIATMIAIGLLGATTAAALPLPISSNTEYTIGYNGCSFKLMHGQFGPTAYAQLKNNGSGTACSNFKEEISNTGSGYNSKSQASPNNNTWYQASVSGTESVAQFTVRGTAYGLTCDLYIAVNSSGGVQYDYGYISGYGTCPAP